MTVARLDEIGQLHDAGALAIGAVTLGRAISQASETCAESRSIGRTRIERRQYAQPRD